MKRVAFGIVLALIGTAGVAFGQTPTMIWHAGFEMGWTFRQGDFQVSDSSQPFVYRHVTGSVEGRSAFGAHAGVDFTSRKSIVVGGEAGFDRHKYLGSFRYSLNNDTVGETSGDYSWNAMGRVGYLVDVWMPYFGFGVIGSHNTALVNDDCNAPPCGTSLGGGSQTISATSWFLAYGVQFNLASRLALRFEWLQFQNKAIVNNFSRTVSGLGIPAGTTAPVTTSTPLPRGALRILIDVRFGHP